jgi:chlorobactene glucosyltransferase
LLKTLRRSKNERKTYIAASHGANRANAIEIGQSSSSNSAQHDTTEKCEPGAVSVIIPARNEETNIERAVRSVGAQKGVREVVVVDDNSADRTAEILGRLAEEFPLLRTIHLSSLPEGWVGKNHAAAVGAGLALGEWLLFTDADTVHLPGSLESVLRRAEVERADLLSLSPGQQTPTWWEKSVIPFVFVQLARLYRFDDVSNPTSSAAAANGQYLLIRRAVYNSIGGHTAVRDEILEDVELARRVKRAGGRLVFLPGAQWVQTRMYRSFGEMWQGWSKNLFLLYGRNLGAMLKTFAEAGILDFLMPLGLVVFCVLAAAGRETNAVLLATILCLAFTAMRYWTYRQQLAGLGFDPGLAKYQVLGAGLLGALLLSSVHRYRWAGEVWWKGRRYPARGQGSE